MTIFINYVYRESDLKCLPVRELTERVLESEGMGSVSDIESEVERACDSYDLECEGERVYASNVSEHKITQDRTNVSITFVDNIEIQRLNAKFRGIDAPTDVLSFEFEDDDGFIDGDGDELFVMEAERELEGDCDTQFCINLPLELGDVIIAPDVAQEQCKQFNMTFEGEISLLLVHGLLHLLGYDHIEDADAKKMQAREIAILEEWKKMHPNVAPPDYEINADMVVGAH